MGNKILTLGLKESVQVTAVMYQEQQGRRKFGKTFGLTRCLEMREVSIIYHTSVILSRSLAIVSLRFNLAFSIASNLTRTASIFETILPIECSIRSTRRLNLIMKQRLLNTDLTWRTGNRKLVIKCYKNYWLIHLLSI